MFKSFQKFKCNDKSVNVTKIFHKILHSLNMLQILLWNGKRNL